MSAERPALNLSLLSGVARRFEQRIQTVNLPIHRASTVLFNTLAEAFDHGARANAGERHISSYGTVGTPTTFALADAIAELEAGQGFRCALAPSGLAAISVALLAFLSPGDHLLVSDSVYGPMRVLTSGLLQRLGIEATFYAPTIGAQIEALIRPNTKLIYLESPGSYTFEVQDVPAICTVARKHNLLTMIDNAWASPLLARPFAWGVDVSLLPLTKYWSGHADVLMGAIVTRDELWPKLWATTRQLGICVGGDDAYLILRGMRTLGVRLPRHHESALTVARWLQRRSEVKSVLHPALPEHPQHNLWKRDFDGASGLFSFELQPGTGDAAVARLCEGRDHFRIGYSWGGFESLIVAARIGHLRTAKPWLGGPLIRLHIGLEDPADLIADLDRGFAAMKMS
jgi:cysteine-S-conjugate beta-lyase